MAEIKTREPKPEPVKSILGINEGQVLKISRDGGKTWRYGKAAPLDLRHMQSGFYIETNPENQTYGFVPITQRELLGGKTKVLKVASEESKGKTFADSLLKTPNERK